MGFGVPVGDWMADTLKEQTERRLLQSPVLPVVLPVVLYMVTEARSWE